MADACQVRVAVVQARAAHALPHPAASRAPQGQPDVPATTCAQSMSEVTCTGVGSVMPPLELVSLRVEMPGMGWFGLASPPARRWSLPSILKRFR